MVFHFDSFHPLINVKINFTEEQMEMINAWFDRVAKPLLIVDQGPPLDVINIENLVRFLKNRTRFHRRDFHYPTYAEVMREVEVVNCHELRLLTREQFIYVINKWVVLPSIKHELILAFHVFDTEGRDFLETEDLRTIVTQYGTEPFHEHEIMEIIRDANVRGDGNVHYTDFVDSMFNVAPELYDMPVEHIYEDPDEDPSVEPEPEPELPPPPPPPQPPEPEPEPVPVKEKGKKKK